MIGESRGMAGAETDPSSSGAFWEIGRHDSAGKIHRGVARTGLVRESDGFGAGGLRRNDEMG